MVSDDQLVELAREGRPDAFDQLMVRYEKLVCKVAMSYVTHRDNALDVTQNVFLKAFRHLEAVTAEGMFKPWLLRITYNESINWLRKRKRTAGREELLQNDVAGAPENGQHAAVERTEQQILVVESLATLNPKYRMAVSLRYAEGLRIREIADTMGCSEGMVKSLLFRGLRQIRDRVQERL